MSIMKRHQQNHGQVLGQMPAAPAAAIASGGLLSGQKLMAFLTASLAEDVKQLKDVHSHERKADIKRGTLIPKYRPYVARLRESDARHDLVGWYLVWLMDSGMVEDAWELARHCVATGQKLPENFKAEPGYFYADTLLAWAEAEFTAGRAFEPYVSALLEDMADADDAGGALPLGGMGGSAGGDSPPLGKIAWNLPDAILARIHRLRGLAAEKAEDLDTARAELARALELGGKVKTALEAVQKKLEKAAPSE